jgi:hypothetical protein
MESGVLTGREVGEPHLHALFTLPAINGDVACCVQDSAAIVEQRAPKRLAHGPKRNCIDEFSITGPETCPHMAVADEVRINEGMGRKRQQWFWITGPVRACPRQHVGECEIEAPGRHRAVERQGNIATRAFYRCGECVFEEGAKGSERIFLQRNAGGHGMTPALEEQPLLNGAAHYTAEVDPRN